MISAWKPGARVLFTGDSVTDCGRSDSPDGRLGSGYVRAIAQSDEGRLVSVSNTGVSGNRVVDLLARWQADVIDRAPDILSILVGINDTWRRYDSDDPTRVEDYEAGYRELLDAAVAGGGALVLVEPFLIPVVKAQRAWREDLDPKIEVVHRLAAEYGATLVPADFEMNRQAEGVGASVLAADGVHPTPLGHERLAALWLATVLA